MSELDKNPGWTGFNELTPEEQANLCARIRADQDRGESLGGGRRARGACGLPRANPRPRPGVVTGSKTAGQPRRESILD